MSLLALLLALALQVSPAAHDQPGVSQPSPNDASREKSASSNTSDKAESLPTEHNTDLQGGAPAKPARKAKSKNAKSKKAQARAAKPLPEPSPAPSVEKEDNTVEREGGAGKARKQPKPLGEKPNQ